MKDMSFSQNKLQETADDTDTLPHRQNERSFADAISELIFVV